MCCVGECIIKYVLLLGNLIFSIVGLVILGLGIAAHVQLQEITDLIPINLSIISVGIIVLGSFVFIIAFLACCGAILKSVWMLITYSICMLIMAGVKIYLAVVMFNFLSDAQATVTGWISNGFNSENPSPAFLGMQTLFSCCGTTGSGSYGPNPLPPSCCPSTDQNQCQAEDAFGGCSDLVASWFTTYGGAVTGILIGVIVFELVFMIFACHVVNTIRNRKYTA
ncbi:unnamed protein product [Arctia plantaginis]|uniref:Tetraspanin n=1 Tax=Arctia plantaginis TaxID=874455 RepID=A0A8S1BCE7_ARCPL|nr:unnamed protein product [Arctia plantaginis]